MAFPWAFTFSMNNTTMVPDKITASHGNWRWLEGHTGEYWSEKRLSPAFLQETVVQRGKPREANVPEAGLMLTMEAHVAAGRRWKASLPRRL